MRWFLTRVGYSLAECCHGGIDGMQGSAIEHEIRTKCCEGELSVTSARKSYKQLVMWIANWTTSETMLVSVKIDMHGCNGGR